MIRFVQLFLASIFLASCVRGWLFSTKDWPVRASGKVTCNGEPVPFVDVELMDDDLWFDDKMGQTTADANGSFQVTGSGRDLLSGKPEPYIRVCYSYSGSYGKLNVVGILHILRRESVSQRSYSSDINFGTINFDSDHCKAYIQFYKALKYYKDVAKSPLPYTTLSVQTKTLIHGGTPYSTTNTVRIPRDYPITYEMAQHEFAHTIRHSFDGSLAHFLYDVARYVYTQNHVCDKKTNSGFAFNEGWAEFYAGECVIVNNSVDELDYYGSTPQDYTYEGNVANALRTLQQKCSSSLYEMVEVLRQRQNSIHSFDDFNEIHDDLHGCKI